MPQRIWTGRTMMSESPGSALSKQAPDWGPEGLALGPQASIVLEVENAIHRIRGELPLQAPRSMTLQCRRLHMRAAHTRSAVQQNRLGTVQQERRSPDPPAPCSQTSIPTALP